MEVDGPLRFRFPRSGRLRKRSEFVAIQTTGRKVHTKYFLVLVQSNGTGRVGITVTKRTGNAVTRNRLKRIVREYIRQARSPRPQPGQAPGSARVDDGWVPRDRDVVVVVKNSAATAVHAELASDLARSRDRVAAC